MPEQHYQWGTLLRLAHENASPANRLRTRPLSHCRSSFTLRALPARVRGLTRAAPRSRSRRRLSTGCVSAPRDSVGHHAHVRPTRRRHTSPRLLPAATVSFPVLPSTCCHLLHVCSYAHGKRYLLFSMYVHMSILNIVLFSMYAHMSKCNGVNFLACMFT